MRLTRRIALERHLILKALGTPCKKQELVDELRRAGIFIPPSTLKRRLTDLIKDKLVIKISSDHLNVTSYRRIHPIEKTPLEEYHIPANPLDIRSWLGAKPKPEAKQTILLREILEEVKGIREDLDGHLASS